MGKIFILHLEEDSILVGMNRVECSDMDILFAGQETNYIELVISIKQTQYLCLLMRLEGPQTKFKNFRWRIDEKPTKEEMIIPTILVRRESGLKKNVKKSFF